jgi:hypothetical protein
MDNTWYEIASLNYRANNPGACSFDNKYVFKFGGKSDDTFLNNTIEKYTPYLNTWEVI